MQNWLQEAVPLLLWLGFVLLPFLSPSQNVPQYVHRNFIRHIFFSNILLLLVFYVHAYGLYPLKKRNKGLLWYFLGIVGFLLIYVYLSRLLAGFRLPPAGPVHMGPPPAIHPPHEPHREFFPHPGPPWNPGGRLLPFLFVIILSYCYCIVRDNTKREKALKDNENEHLKTELTFLRSQVSPHFMFNVLNSMVSLARKQSPLLETSLINLSNLMRYMLYESNGKLVSLTTEIEYLKNYIDLQLLRYGDSVKLNLYLNGNPSHFTIEPMLLIPFVENSFKHGIAMVEDPLIDISLKILPTGVLQFTVVNSVSTTEDQSEDGIGIGLSNVKRRLMLLYPRNHQLKITNDKKIFSIELQIKLT